MSKNCKIIVNQEEHQMLSEVSNYIDNTKNRKPADVEKILRDNNSLMRFRDRPGLFAVESQLKDLRYLNQLIPGLVSITYDTAIKKGPVTGLPTNVYKIAINQQPLDKASIPSDLDHKNQYELDKYTREKQRQNNVEQTETPAEPKVEDPDVKSYTSEETASAEMQKLAVEARIIIETELRDIKLLPEEQRKKKEIRLLRLQAAIKKIKRVDDFYMFAVANKDNINNAIAEFDAIMALPIEERATPAAMNKMYEIKQVIDSMDTIVKLEQIVLDQKGIGKTKGVEDRVEDLLSQVEETIRKAKRLDSQFETQIIPIMAEMLVGFHNEAIDPKIQEIVDNIEKHGDWRRWESEIKNSNEYQELKNKKANNLISEEAFNEEAKKLTLDSFKNRAIPGRAKIVQDLTNAHRDKSGFSYLFDPIIYSSEPAIQLFAKSIKDATFKKNDMTRDFKYDLNAAYEKFAEGMNEADVAKLNEDLLEEVTITKRDEFGNRVKTTVLGLVNPLAVEKYKEDVTKLHTALAKKYNKPLRENYESESEYKEADAKWKTSKDNKSTRNQYYKEVDKWMSENTEPIDNYEQEITRIKRKIATLKKADADAVAAGNTNAASNARIELAEFEKQLNFRVNPITKKPRGPLVKPKASKYTNPKYTAIQNDPRKKEYYDFVRKELVAGHRMIGADRASKNSWEDVSYLMPSIRKNDFDRLREQGVFPSVKELLSESVTVQDTDDMFGKYNEKTGELEKSVPVYYTNVVDAKDVSKDIASSLYGFRDMAHNYKAKSEIVGQTMLFRDIIKNRDTLKVNAAGVAYLSDVANKLGIKLPARKPGESYTYKHVDAFIDTVMFGQRELKENFNLFGKQFSANKIANSINAFTALNTLSFNFLQGANQSIIDNMALISEANAGEFFTREELAWAKAAYWSEGAGLSDTGKFVPDTKLGKALEMFDALTEFTDQEGNRLVGSKLRKALQTGNFLVLQQAAEHEVASTRMLALMRNLKGKLKDKDGNVILNEQGDPADLWDMLITDKSGRMAVDPRVANFSKSDFINLTQGLARRTNQTKGGFDRPTAQRVWYGKLAMLFRSWLLPGLRRRYGHGGFTGKTVHTDEELGTVTQGMYISFWNFARKSFAEKAWPGSVFEQLTEMEQQNVKRTATELGSLAAAFALIAALKNIDDDDENFVTNFILYQTLRYQAEIQQWIPIYGYKEAFRIAKSPTATARQVEQGLKLLDQIALEGMNAIGIPVEDKAIFYQRDTGRYKKGDRKIQKNFEDLMPILRGLNKSRTPEEAAQYFLGGSYK